MVQDFHQKWIQESEAKIPALLKLNPKTHDHFSPRSCKPVQRKEALICKLSWEEPKLNILSHLHCERCPQKATNKTRALVRSKICGIW